MYDPDGYVDGPPHEVFEDLRTLEEGLEATMPEVAKYLGKMCAYLDGLGAEFGENYSKMSWKQRLHEERVKRYLNQDPPPRDQIDDPDDPWLLLEGSDFPKLADLLSKGDLYAEQYQKPYENAKRLLRERLDQFGSERNQAD